MVILILLAFIWPFLPILPVGYVPGDVITNLGGIRLYLAFGTALVLDIIVIFLLYLFQRL